MAARRTSQNGNGHSPVKESAQIQELAIAQTELTQHKETLLFFEERLAELELYLEDQTWSRLSAEGEREFSFEGLKRIRRFARFCYLKNPLINHAVCIQANYVWGQGMSVQCKDDDVNEVVQKFLDDKRNKAVLTGHQMRRQKEIELQVEGDIYIVLFSNPSTGQVLARTIVADEICDIISNPEDASEPWFYKRQWTPRVIDMESGNVEVGETQVAYYPDWKYSYIDGRNMPSEIGQSTVEWDSPIYHVKVGGFSEMRFGVPEVYSALDWAQAVKTDLEDFASIKKALSRFAWQMKTKGGRSGVAAQKTKLSTTLSGPGGAYETNPPPTAGSTLIQSELAGDMTPFRTAGVTANPDEGRRLWLMVSAATGIPETMLSGDANVGTYATAKSLDRPTELQMRDRQTLWSDVYSDILGYVIDRAIDCPNGPLKGKRNIDEYTMEISWELDNSVSEADDGADTDKDKGKDRSVDVLFPSILQRDPLEAVNSIVTAATLAGHPSAGTIDDRTLSKLLLSALGEDDIDEIIDALFPGDEITVGGEDPSSPNPDGLVPAGDPAQPTAPGQSQPTGFQPTDGHQPPGSAVGRQTVKLTPSERRIFKAMLNEVRPFFQHLQLQEVGWTDASRDASLLARQGNATQTPSQRGQFVNYEKMTTAQQHGYNAWMQNSDTINSVFRPGTSTDQRIPVGDARAFAQMVSEHATPMGLTSYRGMSSADGLMQSAGVSRAEDLVGKSFTDKGFSSTSTSRDIATGFLGKEGGQSGAQRSGEAGDKAVLMKLEIAPGTRGMVEPNYSPHEFTLDRNTTFTVTGVHEGYIQGTDDLGAETLTQGLTLDVAVHN